MITLEDELEAAIWSAMKLCGVTCPGPSLFVDAVKQAAVRYGAGDSEALAAMRREILHRDTWPEGHSSPSSSGGVTGTATEQNPPGSVAYPHGAGDGGATRSTRASIPESVTSKDEQPCTPVDSRYQQGVDR